MGVGAPLLGSVQQATSGLTKPIGPALHYRMWPSYYRQPWKGSRPLVVIDCAGCIPSFCASVAKVYPTVPPKTSTS